MTTPASSLGTEPNVRSAVVTPVASAAVTRTEYSPNTVPLMVGEAMVLLFQRSVVGPLNCCQESVRFPETLETFA